MQKCSNTGRTKYGDEMSGKLALARIQLNHARFRRGRYRDMPNAVEQCPFCHGYHLRRRPTLRNAERGD